MRRPLSLLASLGLLSALVACGGGGSPVKGTATVADVTITPGDDFVLIGESLQFTATVRFSDGTSQSQPGTWGSDTPTVAVVDSTGAVTGVTWGKATIYVDIQGHRGTRLLTVMPNYKGQWHGFIILDACRQNGAFRDNGFCDVAPAGSGDTITLDVTQARTSLSGTIDLGGYSGSVTGSVLDDGSTTLASTISAEGLVLTIQDWSVRSAQPGVLTGTFTLRWSVPGVDGAGAWDLHLSGVVRTDGGPMGLAPQALPSGPPLFEVLKHWSPGGR
jgi:hypothetical protein